MADLFDSPSSSSGIADFAFDRDDVSVFLHNMLHGSSPSASSSPPVTASASDSSFYFSKNSHQIYCLHKASSSHGRSPVILLEESVRAHGCGDFSADGCRSEGGNCRSDSTSLPDFCGFDPPGSDERIRDSISCTAGVGSDLIWPNRELYHLNCQGEGSESIDVHAKQLPPRCSSKRTRAAEVHNLSEKRRRSRINEKMKALQMLIPNSNKTDKASMLDEAIEYLKQLQLQVQLLSLRNGPFVHPGCVSGMIPPTQTGFNSGNRNGSMDRAMNPAADHPGSDSSLCL